MQENNSDFQFKDLLVWQKAIEFAKEVISISENINSSRYHYRLTEQIEAAVSSIAMNISEGKGRYSKKEFIHYLHISRGSLFETITLLNIYFKMNWISKDELSRLESSGAEIGKMINGLITSIRKNT